MTDAEHGVLSTQPARELKRLRWVVCAFGVGAMCLATVSITPHSAGASNLSNDRTKAKVLLSQINRMNNQVGLMGQRYNEALIKLHTYNNEIKNTKATVAAIQGEVNKGHSQLRADVVRAYVTNGSVSGNNPLFTKDATKIGATNVYSQLADGNINATIATLKSDRIQLTQERGLLNAEDARARQLTRDAAKSLNRAKVVQAKLNSTLHQVKGQIATFVAQAEAQANSQSTSTLNSAQPTSNFPAPPPDSRANIAVDAALQFLGVPYVWGGASRSGVDCSGLVMLAYEAAGIDLPHYSGAQYDDTMRVPLYDIQPGDLLFYGPGGDTHVAMYVGHGEMIEAPYTGAVVHLTAVRLYGGFVGLGRPRG